ncbi:hypothetical protein ES703_94069 [subsurface metagenome]
MKEILPNKNPEYWEHTEKCPHCFGRGRICKGDYEFLEGTDTYKLVYEEEQALEEVANILKMGQ